MKNEEKGQNKRKATKVAEGEIKAVRRWKLLFSGKSRVPAAGCTSDRVVVSTKQRVTFVDRRHGP